MNLRKLLFISFVVLCVCQLGFSQTALRPDKTLAAKAVATVQASNKPVPVVPLASIAGKLAARPGVIMARSVLVKPTNGVSPAYPLAEPWFCDYNIGSFVLFCPAGVTTAYGVKQIVGANGGAGMTIAIVDAFAYPYAEANLARFNADMGLPPCTTANGCFTSINLSPTDGSGSGWDVESMLDIEYAHAMAPKAKIVYVQAFDNYTNNLGVAEGIAVGAGADVVSNSWSGPEDPSSDFYWNLGKPLLFASGDYQSWPLQGFVGYPCSALTVTCLGGTSLYTNSALQRTSEVGWAGSGGGCSQAEPMPAYQGNNGSGVCAPWRASPDIAAIADPNTGVAIYISNPYVNPTGIYYYGVGGTSLATPVTAGLVADINTARVSFGKTKFTFLNPGLYQAAAYNYNYFYYDVLTGNNGYSAGYQFDMVTGLGNITGKDLANRFFGLP